MTAQSVTRNSGLAKRGQFIRLVYGKWKKDYFEEKSWSVKRKREEYKIQEAIFMDAIRIA